MKHWDNMTNKNLLEKSLMPGLACNSINLSSRFRKLKMTSHWNFQTVGYLNMYVNHNRIYHEKMVP